MKTLTWRLPSDYIGAGRFLLQPERVIVGTDYGVQCLPRKRSSGAGWKSRLGSRCVGLAAGEDGTTIASCVKGLFVLSEDGTERWGTDSLKDIVHEPVPFDGGILFMTSASLHHVREWQGGVWRFDFADVLGSSVKGIRPVNLFVLDGHVVAGAVDYDSGIGCVVVLDAKNGRKLWVSEPGPVSDLFPAGQAVFVRCQTGYGKFETRMTRLDGHEIWEKDFAGLGSVRPDGSLVMVVGSNEAPTWDDWELRLVSNTGKVELELKGKGRCAVRPLVLKDGTIYFIGSALSVDLGGSRMDYTSFFAMPQEVTFKHLMDLKPTFPEYEVTLHRLRPGESALEVIYHATGSYSLADLHHAGKEVILCDGRDILAVEG
ncbi:MAG TPA: PQQ-binding-like beta-propeller repeat protein [Planctomycetota bacterium]|nr:PQQ-binding-like beta-propeller repeat protein [Planctomycetota bacterium]